MFVCCFVTRAHKHRYRYNYTLAQTKRRFNIYNATLRIKMRIELAASPAGSKHVQTVCTPFVYWKLCNELALLALTCFRIQLQIHAKNEIERDIHVCVLISLHLPATSTSTATFVFVCAAKEETNFNGSVKSSPPWMKVCNTRNDVQNKRGRNCYVSQRCQTYLAYIIVYYYYTHFKRL